MAIGIPDYPKIIHHPMDLKTIETMLLNGRGLPSSTPQLNLSRF